ncbi:MFS transporter [Actinokineospora iranica]|uniref:MFS transporter, putative metabolite:H+ symporter n=1 Tax=Actinokineospora iranica TaxID=1271860 RepID=A0A1G6SPG4_9PSEU|nr:MFS transporter [Actinokineospora iranica]SDD18511.1 MFS transporter, putative metabolite:H+ symporter [Actinokineospora iranica]
MSETLAPPRDGATTIGDRMERLPVGRTHRHLTLVVGIGLFFDFFDSNLSGTIAKVLQADFAFGGTELKLVLASAFVGQFVGSIVLGRFADRYGRRAVFMLNLGVYSFFTLLGAFSPNALWLIATRFLAGVGIGAENALSDSYLAEMLPANKRGRYLAWAYTAGFCGVPAVGFAALWLAPQTVMGVDGWRVLFVLGALGSAVVWVLRRELIESPRWLSVQGRDAEADALVRRMEAEAGVPSPVHTPTAVVPQSKRPGIGALLAREYRKRTLVLWTFSVLSVTAYYGFGTLAPQVMAAKGYGIVASLGYVAISFIGYPIGSLLSVPLMDRFERKTLLAASATTMAAFGLGFGYAASVPMLVACGIGYTLVSNVFANASHVYLGEQYPTQIRTTAAGMAYSFSRLSAAAIPFVLLPVLAGHGPGALFTVITVCTAAMVTVLLALGDRTTGVEVEQYVKS